jgi:hypothetical protein
LEVLLRVEESSNLSFQGAEVPDFLIFWLQNSRAVLSRLTSPQCDIRWAKTPPTATPEDKCGWSHLTIAVQSKRSCWIIRERASHDSDIQVNISDGQTGGEGNRECKAFMPSPEGDANTGMIQLHYCMSVVGSCSFDSNILLFNGVQPEKISFPPMFLCRTTVAADRFTTSDRYQRHCSGILCILIWSSLQIAWAIFVCQLHGRYLIRYMFRFGRLPQEKLCAYPPITVSIFLVAILH